MKVIIKKKFPKKKMRDVIRLLQEIKAQGELIMNKADEMLADLESANQATNEIADDVDALLSKLVAGGLSPEETIAVQEQINALKIRLQGVAAKYDPAASDPA